MDRLFYLFIYFCKTHVLGTTYLKLWTGVILVWPSCACLTLLRDAQGGCVNAQTHGQLEGTLITAILWPAAVLKANSLNFPFKQFFVTPWNYGLKASRIEIWPASSSRAYPLMANVKVTFDSPVLCLWNFAKRGRRNTVRAKVSVPWTLIATPSCRVSPVFRVFVDRGR